jgi:hypothetical protein
MQRWVLAPFDPHPTRVVPFELKWSLLADGPDITQTSAIEGMPKRRYSKPGVGDGASDRKA